MRLKHLRIENLGPLELVDLDLKPVTVVMAKNEEGKSFLLDSVRIMRTGTARGLDVRDAAAFTRNGQKGWKIETTIEDGTGDRDTVTLSRTRSQSPGVDALDEAMGDARAWASLGDVLEFLVLSPAERKSMVADLTANDTTALLGVLEEKGATKDILEAVEQGNLRRAHRLAQEARRAFGRALRDHETLVEKGVDDPLVPTKSGEVHVSTLPLEKLDEALAGARGRRDDMLRKAGDPKELERLRKEGGEAKKALEALAEATQWTDVEELALGALENAISGTKGRIATAEATQRLAAAALRNLDELEKQSGPCPGCKRPLDKKAVAELRVQAVEQNRVAVDELEKVRGEQRQNEGEATKRRGRKEAFQARTKAQGKVDALERAEARAKGVDVAPLEVEVSRIQNLRDLRVAYNAAKAAVDTSVKAIERLKGDEKKAAEIETCCTPDRIDDEAATLTKLNDLLAEHSSEIMPGPWVTVTPSWEVTYGGFRVELASKAARIRVGLCIAVALARLSGVRCVLIDELEALDDGARSKVLKLLGALVARGELETAILAAVRSEPPPPATLPDWLGRVWLSGGKAVSV